MKFLDNALVTRLTVTVLIKLMVLAGLWFAFFHDQRVTVDAKQVSDQLLSTTITSETKGEQP